VSDFYKMRARANPGPAWVTWVVTYNPDFAGTYAGQAVDLNSIVVAGSWGSGEIIGNVTLTGASNTLDISHANKMVRVDHGSATSLTVPANATVAYPIGTPIYVAQEGAGQVTIVAAGGVTIFTAETLKLRKQRSSLMLLKVSTNAWQLTGDLELA
jgi:hypothetical protein